MRKTRLATIAALSRSLEAKDDRTRSHAERVSSVASALAQRLGSSGEELEAISSGALLHDIGKIGVPDRILRKPAPLNEEEWKLMREHPVIGDQMLAEVNLHPVVRQIVRSHHERIDGKGYPDGLAGDEIPLPARIVHVANAFDFLTNDLPYRKAGSLEAALEEIRAHAGTQFCPQAVEALEHMHTEN